MAIAYIGEGSAKNDNYQTYTQVDIPLGSTTAGHLNLLIMEIMNNSGLNPTVTTPSGWTKVGEVLDAGTPNVLTVVFWRFFVAGDASSVTVTWANVGQGAGRCLAYSGVKTGTPIPTYAIVDKTLTGTSYSTGAITTSVAGWIVSAFTCRTTGAWSAQQDTVRGTDIANPSAVNMTFQDTNGSVNAGTYTKTATGPSTTVGGQVFILLEAATGGGGGGIAYVAVRGSKSTPNDQTHTSLSVDLASTTINDMNIIAVSAQAGVDTDPVVATPSGWIRGDWTLDQTSGSISCYTAVYYRKFQSGDPSAVTFTWSVAGQMAAVCAAYSGVGSVTNIDVTPKTLTGVNYSIDITTAQAGWLVTGFSNKTAGNPTDNWAAWQDTRRDNPTYPSFNTSSANVMLQDTNGEVAANTYTKTATGTSSTVGGQFAMLLVTSSTVTAHAGADISSIEPGTTVELNGSQSTGGGTYAWTVDSYDSAAAPTITNPTSIIAHYIAPYEIADVHLVFRLTVNGSVSDTVAHQVEPQIEWWYTGTVWQPTKFG